MKGNPAPEGREREVPASKAEPGMLETDDHAMGRSPRGEAQPVEDLDPGVADEHVKSPSQGARPER